MIRTKGDAIAADKTHLAMRCPCKLVESPWACLPAVSDDTLLTDIVRRYRCRRCGQRPELIGAIGEADKPPRPTR